MTGAGHTTRSSDADPHQLAELLTARLGRRPRIAALFDRMNLFAGGYEDELRNAFHATATLLGVDVVLVYGKSIDPCQPDVLAYNRIFARIAASSLDAIVVMSTSLSGTCGLDGLLAFLNQFRSKPLVSIGMALPAIPSVVVSSGHAMTQLVEHLITDHGRKRIAYIGGTPGNPEADARLAAYLDVLQTRRLASIPEFLVPGYFARDRGKQAMQELLTRDLGFDAVVCANDTMAFGAMDALRQANLHIGRQISVTGFDDVLAAKISNPRLTTVAQPFRLVVRAALHHALSQLAGASPPELTELSPNVMLRTSCGCGDTVRAIPHESMRPKDTDIASIVRTQRERLLAATTNALREGSEEPESLAFLLLNALQDELEGTTGQFVATIDSLVQRAPENGIRILSFERAVSSLRNSLRQVTTPLLDDLWHGACDALAVAASAGHIQSTMELHAINIELQSSSDRLSCALDLGTLSASAAASICSLGFSSARITRYPAGNFAHACHLTSVNGGRDAPPPEPTIVDADLFAPSHESNAATYTGLVMPLAFEEGCHGVVAYQYEPNLKGYQLLRDQLSAALRNVTKHQTLLERTREHERITQERAATGQRLEALSMLAGCVAHDLNNALGPIAVLSDLVVSELEQCPSAAFAGLSDVQDDARTIRRSALQATQIVKDLLTLGRQGRLKKEPIDIPRLAKRCGELESMRFAYKTPGLVVDFKDLPERPLYVRGADVQISRALTNLLHNAIEASEKGGKITLSASTAELTSPLTAYETIAPGRYVILSVSDQGCGIPRSDLSRIFEPYFSSKSTSERSGTGLGLAIVHAVVKEHEGFVDVDSDVGKGTTFRLYFPVLTE